MIFLSISPAKNNATYIFVSFGLLAFSAQILPSVSLLRGIGAGGWAVSVITLFVGSKQE